MKANWEVDGTTGRKAGRGARGPVDVNRESYLLTRLKNQESHLERRPLVRGGSKNKREKREKGNERVQRDSVL